jgi:putative ABC transport system substrate-binding protein
MKRREFITLVGGIAAAAALAARAQARRHLIAMLTLGRGSPAESEPDRQGLLRLGLRALGYGDEDITIEIRAAEGRPERLPDLAAELVRLAPEVIVAYAPAAVQAAKQATSTIPIVMVDIADPAGAGFISSLAHPGGNITGLANLAQETVGKRLQLLKTVTPGVKRIAILLNPKNAGNVLQLQAAGQASPTLGLELISVEASHADDIEGAFAAMTREHADALFVASDPVFGSTARTVTKLAASRKLPAIYQHRLFVEAGGLMSYGTGLNDLHRHAAAYVAKILKGEKPADLPVEQPTKFELVINLGTANALGLRMPQSLLALADEVIE